MAVEQQPEGDSLFVRTDHGFHGVRRVDIVEEKADLDTITVEARRIRSAQYLELDDYLASEVALPEGEAYNAFSLVAASLREQAEADRLRADMRKDHILGLPYDADKASRLEDASSRVTDAHIAVTLARNTYGESARVMTREPGQRLPGDTFTAVETDLQDMIPGLIAAEAAMIRLRYTQPDNVLQWRSVGTVRDADVRRKPNEPTHAQIEAMATQFVAIELGARKRRIEITRGLPTGPATPKPRGRA